MTGIARPKMAVVLAASVVLMWLLAGSLQAQSAPLSAGRWLTQEAGRVVTAQPGRCSSCGKKIPFGSKCLACAAKEAREAAKRAAERGKRAIDEGKRKLEEEKQQRARKCEDCGKTIYAGSLCTACRSKRAAEKTRDLGRKGRDAAEKAGRAAGRALEEGQRRWRESESDRRALTDRSRRAFEDFAQKRREVAAHREEISRWVNSTRHDAEVRFRQAARQYVPAIERAVRDPENQRRAIEAVGAAIEVHRQWEQIKRDTTYRSLKTLGGLPVRMEGGRRMTLEQLARERLVGEIPALAGTDIADDPAAVTTALICRDTGYFLSEMRIVENRGEHVSIVEGLRRSSNLDVSDALEYLSIIEACEDLSNGDDPLGALDDIAGSVENLKK